jgi:hypothetical protein
VLGYVAGYGLKGRCPLPHATHLLAGDEVPWC